jgi:hypothetical protein
MSVAEDCAVGLVVLEADSGSSCVVYAVDLVDRMGFATFSGREGPKTENGSQASEGSICRPCSGMTSCRDSICRPYTGTTYRSDGICHP